MESCWDKYVLPPTVQQQTKASLDFDVIGERSRMTGADITPWTTEKHFSSQLGLSPGNKITGGKILTSKTKPSASRAAAALHMAVYGLFNSQIQLPSVRWVLLPAVTNMAGISHGDYCHRT